LSGRRSRAIADIFANNSSNVGASAAANTISDFQKLKIDADAAIDFVKSDPYNLEDLQVSSEGYEEFSSYANLSKAS
jgi:hypothetical protein